MTLPATYFRLCQRLAGVRERAELGFVICNETRQLVEYRQAALLTLDEGNRARLIAHSGLSDTDRNTPYALWLAAVAKAIAPRCRALPANLRLLPLYPDMLSPALAQEWPEWLPEHVWVFALAGPDDSCRALLLLGRDTPWPETLAPDSAEFLLLQLCGLYGYAWWSLSAGASPIRRFLQKNTGKRLLWGLAALLLILCIPVREYSLVPAEIVSLKSEVITVPEQGVIKRMVVAPNSPVKAGDVLALLDDTTLQNRLAVARAELDTANLTLHQTTQKAMEDQQAKSDLAMAAGRYREKQVEVASLERDLKKLTLRAPGDGVFVYSDPDDWTGRPVQTGERIGLLADPSALGVRGWAPVGEYTNLAPGAPITLFLKVAPLDSLSATLTYAGYQAVEAPNGVASYLLRGTLDGNPGVARIGLQGTARVTGSWQALGYLLFRRPLASLRAWVGW